MIVVDTSAILRALAVEPPNVTLNERIDSDPDLHAPHLIDIELLHALRRLTGRRRITDARAASVRADFADLSIVRYPHHPIADRIWELRYNLSAYDAAFVALAEAMEVPLVTCDARLARAAGHQARVEVYA